MLKYTLYMYVGAHFPAFALVWTPFFILSRPQVNDQSSMDAKTPEPAPNSTEHLPHHVRTS